eukprot:7693881-Alexandrium_andersonii.AAC.1
MHTKPMPQRPMPIFLLSSSIAGWLGLKGFQLRCAPWYGYLRPDGCGCMQRWCIMSESIRSFI